MGEYARLDIQQHWIVEHAPGPPSRSFTLADGACTAAPRS
jgi:hypothetical protein